MAARTNKTFRADDALIEALKAKSLELEISESDVINKALRCFLGVAYEPECASYSEIKLLENRLNELIKINHLIPVP